LKVFTNSHKDLEIPVANYFLINNSTLHLYSSRALTFFARVHNTPYGVYHTIKSLIYVGIS